MPNRGDVRFQYRNTNSRWGFWFQDVFLFSKFNREPFFLAIQIKWYESVLFFAKRPIIYLKKYHSTVKNFRWDRTKWATVQFYTSWCYKKWIKLMNKHSKWNKVNYISTTICKLGAKQGFWKKRKIGEIWKKKNGEGL